MLRNWSFFILFIALLLLSGCGGGDSPPAPPTRAVVSFSLISTSRLPFRISGVQIDGLLPPALAVETTPSGTTRKNVSNLVAGSAVGSAASWQPVFGSYSSPQIRIVLGDSSGTGFGPGEMVRLTCGLVPGKVVTEAERLALEQGLIFRASGIDPNAATNPSPLDGHLKASVSVSFLP